MMMNKAHAVAVLIGSILPVIVETVDARGYLYDSTRIELPHDVDQFALSAPAKMFYEIIVLLRQEG